MELFMHISGSKRPVLVELEAATLVRTLLVEDDADAQIWLKDVYKEVDLDSSFEAAGLWHRDHVHRGHCRHIEVTVQFNRAFEHVFGPATSIRTIAAWVFGPEAVGFSEDQTGENVLAQLGAAHFLEDDVLVGSLVKPGSCSVTLELLPLFPFSG